MHWPMDVDCWQPDSLSLLCASVSAPCPAVLMPLAAAARTPSAAGTVLTASTAARQMACTARGEDLPLVCMPSQQLIGQDHLGPSLRAEHCLADWQSWWYRCCHDVHTGQSLHCTQCSTDLADKQQANRTYSSHGVDVGPTRACASAEQLAIADTVPVPQHTSV